MPEKDSAPPEKFKVRKIQEDEKLSFTAHLAELRHRLIASVAAVLVGFAVCYLFIDTFIHILEMPIKSAVPSLKLTFLSPTEGFFVSMKVAFFAGFTFAYPIVIYQVWMFVSPGLVKKERSYGIPIVLLGSLLFFLGVSFNYYVILPLGLKFLINFGQEYWMANISVDYYLSFCLKLTLAFGLVFQIPLIIAILGKLGIVSSGQLKKWRGYFVVLSFVVSAILTPPDVITQCLMAAPLIVLYELSIYIVKLIEKKEKGDEETEDEA